MAVAIVYLGLLLGLVGIVSVARPLRFLGVRTRIAGAGFLLLGLAVAAAGAALPAPLLAPTGERALLDDFVPACQFREVHEIRIHAPADAVFRAVRAVTAREIRFFQLLTWLRSPRLTRAREDILAPPADRPLLDVALRSGFLMLAEDPPRELVFGTLLCGRLPRVSRPAPRDFMEFNRPGFCKVAMNFRLREEGGGWVATGKAGHGDMRSGRSRHTRWESETRRRSSRRPEARRRPERSAPRRARSRNTDR